MSLRGNCGPSVSVLVVLALLLSAPVSANTEKYRLTWRDDPATTMVIGWVQASGTDPVVYYDTLDYGTNWAAYSHSSPPNHATISKGMDHRFLRLTALRPDTAYYFVIKDSDGVSDRIWFRTAPDTCKGFTVVAGGDSRTNRTPRVNANKIVSKLRPLFVLFGGDFISNNSNNAEWEAWLDDWQYTRSDDGRMYPIVAARGNHEDNATVQDIFDPPDPEIYFALSYGGSLLRTYTLNSEITEGGPQANWLETDLAANASGHIFNLACYHKPMRPHRADKSEGNAEYTAWAQIFFDYGMNLAVEADSHIAKRTWPVRPFTGSGSDEGFIRDDLDGTVYVGEGGWGAPLRLNDDDKDWTRDSGSFYQLKWIHVRMREMELRTVRTDNADSVGTVYDSDPFTPPPNLDLWNPPNGDTVVFPARYEGAADVDGDGVPDLCDPCPLDDPDDTDEDLICDSEDVVVTSPPGGERLDCTDPRGSRPTITWNPGNYDRFKPCLASTPTFDKGTRTCSKKWRRGTSWTPGRKTWRHACKRAVEADPLTPNPLLYIRVLGTDGELRKKDPDRNTYSQVVEVTVQP